MNEIATVADNAAAMAFAQSYVFDAPRDLMVACRAAGFGDVAPQEARRFLWRPSFAASVREMRRRRDEEHIDELMDQMRKDATDIGATVQDRTRAADAWLKAQHRQAMAAARPVLPADTTDRNAHSQNATQNASVSEIAQALLTAIEDGGTTLRGVKVTTLS